MGTIVTEPVYQELPDGRTVLAAAVGDELTEAQASALQVGADGTSSNGVTPADKLPAGPEPMQPGAAAPDAGQTGSTTAEVDFASMNARDTIAAVESYDADQLTALEEYETSLGAKSRSTVAAAITSRREQLDADAAAAESETS